MQTLPCHGAVVQEALLLRMGLAIGDRFKIGKAEFLITGLVRTEPDRMANAFSLGPRVIISAAGLKSSALVQPGSRIRERELLRLPPQMPLEPLRAELRGRLVADHVRVSGYRDAQPQLKQFLEQLSRYLGLIGLTALFIGGLGVAMSIHAFMQEKLKTIAILKTLGADSSVLIGAYVLQAMGLGLIGSGAGMLLGILLQRVLPPLLAGAFVSDLLDQVGASTELSAVSIGPLLKGGALGLLTTLLFSLWPLLRVRDVAPSAIFRREVDQETGGSSSRSSWRAKIGLQDRFGMTAAAALIFGLAALSVWQAGSWRVGGWYIGGVVLAILTLLGCARLLVAGLRLIPKPAVPHAALRDRQCVAARRTYSGDTRGDRAQRDGHRHGLLGRACVASTGRRDPAGGCADILLHRSAAGSNSRFCQADRRANGRAQAGDDPARAVSTPCRKRREK